MSRFFPRAVAQQMPTLVILLGLALLGWWGAVNEWHVKQMFPWPKDAPKEAKKADTPTPNPNVGPDPIELDTARTADEAGIRSAEAKRQAVVHVVTAPGVLAFDNGRHARPTAPINGTVWSVLAGSGDRVHKGQVLALVSAQEASKLRADFLSAWVTHDVKKRHLGRFEQAGGSVPERQILDARLALREAHVVLLGAHRALAGIGLGFPLDSLRGRSDDEVNRRVRLLGVPASVRDADDLPSSLVPITSPIDGVVIRSDILLGEQTGPGQTPFVVADTSHLWLRIDVRQEDADRVELGQPLTFRATATGQNASGVISWVSAEVDPKTHTVKARAEVYNPTGRLRPATFGRVEIEVGNASLVTVPDAAVQWDGEARRVFVRRDGRTFAPRLVLTGTSRNDRTELLDPRVLLPVALVGRVGVLGMLGGLAAGTELLVPVAHGDVVAAEGSNVLKSEMLKSRIGGDE